MKLERFWSLFFKIAGGCSIAAFVLMLLLWEGLRRLLHGLLTAVLPVWIFAIIYGVTIVIFAVLWRKRTGPLSSKDIERIKEEAKEERGRASGFIRSIHEGMGYLWDSLNGLQLGHIRNRQEALSRDKIDENLDNSLSRVGELYKQLNRYIQSKYDREYRGKKLDDWRIP